MRESVDYPAFRNHFVPRTRAGRRTLVAFVLLFLLAEPPLLFWYANRIEPWLFGHPFLYSYLAIVYFAQMALLLVAHRRGV